MLCMKIVKTANPEFSSQGKKFFFCLILYLYQIMDDVH